MKANPDPRRRRRILIVAGKLFSHYGASKTTVGDIAREAGIGVGTVYLEFRSKGSIVTALSDEKESHVVASMRAAASQPDQDHAQRLAAMLTARVEALYDLAKEGAHACELMQCSADQKVPQMPDPEAKLLAEVLRAGSEAGELSVPDVQVAVSLMRRAYATLTPPHLFQLRRADARKQVEAMNRLLLDGLLKR